MVEKRALPTVPDLREGELHSLELTGTSRLKLFMAANQVMVMRESIREFNKEYPKIQRICDRILPPGLQLKQTLSGSASFRNRFNMKVD